MINNNRPARFLLAGFLLSLIALAAWWHQPALTAHASTVSRWIKSEYGNSAILLADFYKSTRAVGQIHKVVVPYGAYWTAKLETTINGADFLIPIYRSFSEPSTAFVIAPENGLYTLTISIPSPHDEKVPTEFDPPNCLAYSCHSTATIPEWWGNSHTANSTSLRHMEAWCATIGQQSCDDFWQSKGAYKSSGVLTSAASIKYTAQVRFSGSAHEDSLTLADAALQIYGISPDLLKPSPAEMLGYWKNDGTVTTTTGSQSYQPQPEHCPDSFTEAGNHQGVCAGQASVPAYKFHPFAKTRREWLPTPEDLNRCVERTAAITFHGDSIMWEAFRGSACNLQGYAGLDRGFYLSKMTPKMLLLDIIPFFAPRDALLPAMTTEEADKLLSLDPNPVPGTVEYWNIGMWPISYAHTAEFSRGMHRIFSHVASRRDRLSTRPFVALLTSPLSEPKYTEEPGWQTAERSAIWNHELLKVAEYYRLPIIDAFYPSIHRFDARTDNCHLCDSVNTETAMMWLRAMCME